MKNNKIIYLVKIHENGNCIHTVFFENIASACSYAQQQMREYYYDVEVSIHLIPEGYNES